MTTNIPMFSRAKGIPGTNGINGRIVLAVPACVPIWYDELKAEHLPKLAADGCKQVVVYAVGGSNVVAADDQFLNGRLANYLDTAETLGITVIVSVMWIVQAGDMNALATYAAKFASYPALAGWYVLDEPPANNQQRINHAVTAYGILKAATPSLPTYMAFMLFGNSGAEMLAIPGQYQAAYDVLMWGLLPIIPG